MTVGIHVLFILAIAFFVALYTLGFKRGWFERQFEKKGNAYYKELSPDNPADVQAYLASIKKRIRLSIWVLGILYILYIIIMLAQ